MKSIPVVDIRSTFVPGEGNWTSVAEKLTDALHETGFLYLTGHGIDLDLIHRAFEVSKSFFELPLHKKQKYERGDMGESYAGYAEVQEERMPGMKNFEYKECLNIDLSRPVFPTEPANFQPVISDFFPVCSALKDRVFRLIATGLGVEDIEAFMANVNPDGVHRNQNNFKMVRYPGIPKGKEVPEDMVRCGEHTDWGALTFLFQDEVRGLEAKTAEDEWVPVLPIPGSIVINVGEIFERWTHGYLRATPHRVLMVDEEGGRWKDRYSLVFFCNPNDNVSVNPLSFKLAPASAKENSAAVEKPMTVREFFAWRADINNLAY